MIDGRLHPIREGKHGILDKCVSSGGSEGLGGDAMRENCFQRIKEKITSSQEGDFCTNVGLAILYYYF